MPKPKKNDHAAIKQWETVLSNLKDKAEQSQEIETLNENVWLILGENGLSFYGYVVAAAHTANLHYESLFFEKATRWSCKAE